MNKSNRAHISPEVIMPKDREIITRTFTVASIAEAKTRLELDLDTGIVVAPHSKGFHHWAAKFARAWGTMLENDDGSVFVEVTEGTALGVLDPAAMSDTMDSILAVPVWLNRSLTRKSIESTRGDLEIALAHLDTARSKLTELLSTVLD